ncbi:hypothetical protein P26059A_0076 [Curvibacter phage P26059A]|nr:hypothetical protein P26059A_0076 [Curvibacter phage P26059A]
MKRSEIHPDLLVELKKTEEKYKKVTAFADKLPLFSKNIVRDELTGESYSRLTSWYKTLNLQWGVNWEVNVELTNRDTPLKKDEIGLVAVYINCYSMFPDDCYATAYRTLHSADIKSFYVDWMNSTFYFKPSQVEAGLEVLHDWYLKITSQIKEIQQAKRKAELQAELAKLEGAE